MTFLHRCFFLFEWQDFKFFQRIVHVRSSKSFLEVLEPEEKKNMVELLEEDLISLNLGSKDDDQRRLFRKKVRDKWNQLVFVPMVVLQRRDMTSGGKAGKREGFNTFNRFLTMFRFEELI